MCVLTTPVCAKWWCVEGTGVRVGPGGQELRVQPSGGCMCVSTTGVCIKAPGESGARVERGELCTAPRSVYKTVRPTLNSSPLL